MICTDCGGTDAAPRMTFVPAGRWDPETEVECHNPVHDCPVCDGRDGCVCPDPEDPF